MARYIIVTVPQTLTGEEDYRLIVDTEFPPYGNDTAVARTDSNSAVAIRDALNAASTGV